MSPAESWLRLECVYRSQRTPPPYISFMDYHLLVRSPSCLEVPFPFIAEIPENSSRSRVRESNRIRGEKNPRKKNVAKVNIERQKQHTEPMSFIFNVYFIFNVCVCVLRLLLQMAKKADKLASIRYGVNTS